MTTGRISGTGHIERIVFNENGEVRREQLLNDLRQRIRFVRQGLDGFIYLLTDENEGAILRIEPVSNPIANSVPTVSLADDTASEEGDPMFGQFDCANCHLQDNRTIGPSYREIAKKYDRTESNIEMLATKIIEGSEGVWGDIPMTPHSDIDKVLAKEMVESILEL
jgi:cytochrome c